ncbi:hypothetical protein [Psychromonas aquatilis]|uniref:Uncharacterized protein n=1 Tax=Psychromonas aquatilis TaxID=2005072 RepID=A0ABU9GU49_9GAMM
MPTNYVFSGSVKSAYKIVRKQTSLLKVCREALLGNRLALFIETVA